MFTTHHYLHLDGSRLHVGVAGSGEALLLGHSYLWDAQMWAPQIQALSQTYRVIVPELWGHGTSGPLPSNVRGLDDLARQYLTLMNYLEIDRFSIIGLSVGGMWGAELARLAPHRVNRLLLADTYLGEEPPLSRDRYFVLFELIEQTRGLPAPVIDQIAPLFFSPEVETRAPDMIAAFRQRLRTWDTDRILDSVLPLGRLIFGRPDRLAEVAETALPKLVLTGAHDIPRPPAEGRRMAQALECPYVEIPGAGHISNIEAPDTFTKIVETFLCDDVVATGAATGSEYAQ